MGDDDGERHDDGNDENAHAQSYENDDETDVDDDNDDDRARPAPPSVEARVPRRAATAGESCSYRTGEDLV